MAHDIGLLLRKISCPGPPTSLQGEEPAGCHRERRMTLPFRTPYSVLRARVRLSLGRCAAGNQVPEAPQTAREYSISSGRRLSHHYRVDLPESCWWTRCAWYIIRGIRPRRGGFTGSRMQRDIKTWHSRWRSRTQMEAADGRLPALGCRRRRSRWHDALFFFFLVLDVTPRRGAPCPRHPPDPGHSVRRKYEELGPCGLPPSLCTPRRTGGPSAGWLRVLGRYAEKAAWSFITEY